jgi:hypothetical protein
MTNLAAIMKATRRKFPAGFEAKAAIIFLTMSLSLTAIVQEQEMPERYEENAYLARMMKLVGHKQTHLLELQGIWTRHDLPGIPLSCS